MPNGRAPASQTGNGGSIPLDSTDIKKTKERNNIMDAMNSRICDACGRTPAPHFLREMGNGGYWLCDRCDRVSAMGDWGRAISKQGEMVARLRAVVTAVKHGKNTGDTISALHLGDMGEELL